MSPPEKVPYGEHRSQYGELALPDGDGPHPVAVLVHGGRWEHFYGRQIMRPQAEDLVARGWATWNVEYRRLGGDGGYEATHADVAAAVDLLAERPEPLDLSTVVAIGHSAGGQLALWLAARGAPITGAPRAASQRASCPPAEWPIATTVRRSSGSGRAARASTAAATSAWVSA